MGFFFSVSSGFVARRRASVKVDVLSAPKQARKKTVEVWIGSRFLGFFFFLCGCRVWRWGKGVVLGLLLFFFSLLVGEEGWWYRF